MRPLLSRSGASALFAAVGLAALTLAACSEYGGNTAQASASARRARPADARRTQGHGGDVADPHPHLQGRIGAGGLEAAEVDRPLRAPEDLRHLRLVRRCSVRRSAEGDRQAPEGFYTITPGADEPEVRATTSPSTSAIRTNYDRSLGRTGSHLMVHGACSSRGCYSMTDENIQEIYTLGRLAFQGGQRDFQVQAFPVPHDAGEHGAAPRRPEHALLADAEGRLRPFRRDAAAAQGRRLRAALRLQLRAADGRDLQRDGRLPADERCPTRSASRVAEKAGDRTRSTSPSSPRELEREKALRSTRRCWLAA